MNRIRVTFKSGASKIFVYEKAENLRDDLLVAMQVLGNPRANNGYLGSSSDGFVINALDISAVEVLEMEEEKPETTPDENPGEA